MLCEKTLNEKMNIPILVASEKPEVWFWLYGKRKVIRFKAINNTKAIRLLK